MADSMAEAGQCTVLLTGGGGAGTIEVIRSLRATGRYRVVAVDASPYAGGFSFADAAYVVPFGADPAFPEAIEAVMRTERPDFVIPLVDEEIPVFHRMAPRFAPVRVVAPTPEFCARMLDKWEMYRALTDAGLSVARSWLASSADGCVYPAVVKPRSGRGSRGVAYLDTSGDLEAYLRDAALPADAYVVQERIVGTEFTVSAVVGLDGEVLAVVPKEVVDKRGITHVGITRRVDAIDALCRGIASRLDAGGPFNVQLMLDADGVPHVFEVNPRYSTTVALTLGAGLDEVDVVIRRAQGGPSVPLDWAADLMMVRFPTQVYVPVSSWSPVAADSLPGPTVGVRSA